MPMETTRTRTDLKAPSVSVVIPLYNKGPHIRRAIESVLSQTHQPDEIIIVDDGSTDGSAEIVEGMAVDKLRLIRRGVPGPAGSAARNRGIEAATSDWIALLDADDEWLANHLEVFARTLRRQDDIRAVVSVFSGFDSVYAGGRRQLDPFTLKIGNSAASSYEFSALIDTWIQLNASPIWTSASIFRRQTLIEAGLFPVERCSRGVDKDTWLRVAYFGLSVPTNEVTAIYYRESVNMVTKKPFANRIPCIQSSIEMLQREGARDDQQRLQRLGNLEIYNYAVATTKFEPLRRETWQDFRGDIDPLRKLVLEVVSLGLVSWVIRRAYELRQAVRRT